MEAFIGADTPVDQPFIERGASIRVTRGLRLAGIKTLGELCRHTRRQLLKQPNVGKVSVNQIEAILADIGLTLARTTSPGRGLGLTWVSQLNVVARWFDQEGAVREARMIRWFIERRLASPYTPFVGPPADREAAPPPPP